MYVHNLQSERRDADKKTYERLRQPRRLCREYALEDGRRSRKAATALARKGKYTDARARLEDARVCFDWAGGAEEELGTLHSVRSELEVRCMHACLTTRLLLFFCLKAAREPDGRDTHLCVLKDTRDSLQFSRLSFGLPEPGVVSTLHNSTSKNQVRENATCGDRLTEGVASKLQFLTSKNYSKLFSELSQAAAAYEIAKDQDGAKVTNAG